MDPVATDVFTSVMLITRAAPRIRNSIPFRQSFMALDSSEQTTGSAPRMKPTNRELTVWMFCSNSAFSAMTAMPMPITQPVPSLHRYFSPLIFSFLLPNTMSLIEPMNLS